jgi:hypothetical protein
MTSDLDLKPAGMIMSGLADNGESVHLLSRDWTWIERATHKCSCSYWVGWMMESVEDTAAAFNSASSSSGLFCRCAGSSLSLKTPVVR